MDQGGQSLTLHLPPNLRLPADAARCKRAGLRCPACTGGVQVHSPREGRAEASCHAEHQGCGWRAIYDLKGGAWVERDMSPARLARGFADRPGKAGAGPKLHVHPHAGKGHGERLCAARGCGRRGQSMGLCKTHYTRYVNCRLPMAAFLEAGAPTLGELTAARTEPAGVGIGHNVTDWD